MIMILQLLIPSVLHQYKTVVDNQPASLQVKPAFKTILKMGIWKKEK